MVYPYNVCIGRYNNNLCPHLRVDHLVLALLLPCYLSCLQVTANWLLYKKYSQQLRPLICRDPTERIFITFWVSFILLILSLTRHTESSFGTHLTRKLFLSKLKVINFPFLFQQQQEWRRRRHTCYQKNFTRKLLSLSRIIPDCSEIFQAEPNVLSTMNSNPEINKVCQF